MHSLHAQCGSARRARCDGCAPFQYMSSALYFCSGCQPGCSEELLACRLVPHLAELAARMLKDELASAASELCMLLLQWLSAREQ